MSSKLKTKLEYIWLDGSKPTQSLRSKTKIGARPSGFRLPRLRMVGTDGWKTVGQTLQRTLTR